MKIFIPIVSAFILLLLSTCDSPVDVASVWTDSEIANDNDTAQWNNIMHYPDDPQFGIGVRNDARYLYLRMVSWNREVNGEILHRGFTAWFTSPSKKGKRFGIHFPLGMAGSAPARHQEIENEKDPAERKARLMESLQEMELLGPEKDDSIPVKTRVAESFGIGVGMFPSEKNLVYEMKVPLREDSLCKYAIDIGNDSLLKAAFETTVRAVEEHGVGEGGGESHGMGGGSKGMGGGGGRGGGEAHERLVAEDMPSQFKASFSIMLSQKPK
jgi:hypothetical protein